MRAPSGSLFRIMLVLGGAIAASAATGYLILSRTPPPPCSRVSDFTRCAVDALERTAAEQGPIAAFAEMRGFLAMHPDAAACHTYTHAIGAGAFRAMERGLPLELGDGVSACGYGFYHGLLEAFLVSGKPRAAAVALCQEVDASLPGRDVKGQCLHGIGHGIMADPDLAPPLTTHVTDALGTCESIAEDTPSRAACASGVMNALGIAYASTPGALPDPEHPLAICATLAGPYQEPCYANMNVVLAKLTGNDAPRGLALAAQAPPAHRAFTVRLLAAYLASFRSEPAELAELSGACAELSQELRTSCREGIAHGILEAGADGREYERAFSFCRTTGPDLRACMGYSLRYLPSLHASSEMPGICREAGEEFRGLCPLPGN